MKTKTVIIGAARTPIGCMSGAFTEVTAMELGATAIKGALQSQQINPEHIHEVSMGCVLSAGCGQAPARQASIKAGLASSIPATTVNKMCGSGMQTVIFAHQSIQAQKEQIIVAGGQENMTRAPYLLNKARQGYRLGHHTLHDHMFVDGLEDAYSKQLMGHYADRTAEKYKISRVQQDEFSLLSHSRAREAQASQVFDTEITPVIYIDHKKNSVEVNSDECPREVEAKKIAKLTPAFDPDGTVTAANASCIADGAAALILTSKTHAAKYNYQPLAYLVATATHAQAPEWFTTAPAGAIKKCCQQCEWDLNSVDLFEINEAFAVVSLVTMQELGIPHEKVNILGGACALGHPIGATGTRIIVTLMNALKQQKKKRGIAALCIGGGEAIAIAIELG